MCGLQEKESLHLCGPVGAGAGVETLPVAPCVYCSSRSWTWPTEEHNAFLAQRQALEYQERAGAALITPADVDCHGLCGLMTQVLPGVLAAAADADATAFIIASGPSARTGTKSSSGGGLFAFGARGAQGADRAVQLAEKAGVGSYFVLRGAGLTPSSPPSAAPGLIVAEGGSADPALAGQVRLVCLQGPHCCRWPICMLAMPPQGINKPPNRALCYARPLRSVQSFLLCCAMCGTLQVGVEDVTRVLSALLEAPVLPAGGAVLDVAGTGVDAGTVEGQLAAALASVNEKNAEKNAARAAERAAAPRPPAKSPVPFGFGAKVRAMLQLRSGSNTPLGRCAGIPVRAVLHVFA